jgi:hypothetical protein
MRKLELAAIVLSVCLLISLLLSVYLHSRFLERQQERHSTFFSFVFGPTMQNITTGDLYINLTFDTYMGNLTVKAEINADSYDSNAVLALQFDSDNNGTMDIRYWPEFEVYYYDFTEDDLQFLLKADGSTRPSFHEYWGWLPNGTIYFSKILPSQFPWYPKSEFHTCTYEEGLYDFNFTFPITPSTMNLFGGLIGSFGIQGKLVRVLFCIEPSGSTETPEKGLAVYVPPFDFME